MSNNPYDGPTEAEERAMEHQHAIEDLHEKHGVQSMDEAPTDGSEIALYISDDDKLTLTRVVVFYARGKWWDTNGTDRSYVHWNSWETVDPDIVGWLPLSRGRIHGDQPQERKPYTPDGPALTGDNDDDIPF